MSAPTQPATRFSRTATSRTLACETPSRRSAASLRRRVRADRRVVREKNATLGSAMKANAPPRIIWTALSSGPPFAALAPNPDAPITPLLPSGTSSSPTPTSAHSWSGATVVSSSRICTISCGNCRRKFASWRISDASAGEATSSPLLGYSCNHAGGDACISTVATAIRVRTRPATMCCERVIRRGAPSGESKTCASSRSTAARWDLATEGTLTIASMASVVSAAPIALRI